VLTLVRDKALRNLSAGFAEGRNRWHTRDRVTRLSTTLDHAALVRRGAYPGACLRSAHGQADPLQILGPPPTVSALARPCLVCGQPVVGASRCPSCAPAKAKRKTAARGYGAAHQARRAKTLTAAYGEACGRCGKPMLEGQALDLDHTDDRTGYMGFAHAACNRQAGGRNGAAVFSRRSP
jgi:hypothetical protein